MKSQEEVEQLKKDWCKDPCWDIEDTEGFEEHRDELTQFSESMKKHWEKLHKEKRIRFAEQNFIDVQGMTRLDYFSGIAMNALLSNSSLSWYGQDVPRDIAKESIRQAKALIAALDEEK